MKKLLALTVASVFCLGIAGHALAGDNPNYNTALDIRTVAKGTTCASLANTYTSCGVINEAVTPVSGQFYVVPVVYLYNDFNAIEFGLDWGSSSVMYTPGWATCSDFEIKRIGATDASFALTWTTCKTPAIPGASGIPMGVLTVPNGFTPGGPVAIHYKNSDGGYQRMVDCNIVTGTDEVHTAHGGYVNQAPAPGDLEPCTVGPTATMPSTWSGVKALYR
jgi:hypothetical protein